MAEYYLESSCFEDEFEEERRYEDRYFWTTKLGQHVRIYKMSDQHLLNTIAFIRRKGLAEILPQYPLMQQEAKNRGLDLCNP